jgi:hypothetical protein
MSDLKATPIEIQWHPGLSIYASEVFLRAEADDFGWIGGTDEDGHLRCILPYTIIRKFGFHLVRFRTKTISLEEEIVLEEERSFLKNVVEYFRSTGADIIIPSGNTAIFRTYPEGADAAPYGTFIKDLKQPEETLTSEIRKTYRQNIRKALAEGVQIRMGMEYLDVSYSLIADTLKRSKVTFKTLAEFKRMVLGLGEHVKIFVAEHNGAIQGCMVSPFSTYSAYNCYSGSRSEPVLGAMHLLHWEAIRRFREWGVNSFDFQGVRIDPEKGSKQEGIANYKKGFGGALVQGFLWKYPLRPLKAIGYSIAARLLKGGDIVDLERHKIGKEHKLK